MDDVDQTLTSTEKEEKWKELAEKYGKTVEELKKVSGR